MQLDVFCSSDITRLILEQARNDVSLDIIPQGHIHPWTISLPTYNMSQLFKRKFDKIEAQLSQRDRATLRVIGGLA